jgi:PIN domain nuclease of toxin-antitoxin system
MNLLLDTHTAIWFITDNKNLPENSKALILDIHNQCFLSIASLWEIGIKYSLGRLTLHTELHQIFEIFIESGFSILPIEPEHIVENSKLKFYHRDPFDRLIISQAIIECYTIISRDKLFKHYDVNLLWD